MNNKDILEIALAQSAKDYSVEVNAFYEGPYSIHLPKEVSKEARNYLTNKPYCNLVYYGASLVAIADKELHPFLENYIGKNKDDLYRVFDAPQITSLNNELEKRNYCIAHLADCYLLDVTYQPILNKNITTKIYEGDELLNLYSDKRFAMALDYSRNGKRVDEIALVGYIDGQVAGIAGATNDSDTMWQIGVDVLEEYRYLGIASTITYLLSQEILNKGIVPFYCCAWSNIASRNTARKAGFRSAWVELTAKKTDEEWIKNIRTDK